MALPARLESVLKGLAENGSGNRHRHHELFEVLGRRSWLTEQADMGIRSPDVVERALKSRSGPRTTLADAHHLAATEQHLTTSDAGKAHMR